MSMTCINGIHFNHDGTKMFTFIQTNSGSSNILYVNEYNLSTPFDVSTRTYAGDSERCN